MSSLPVRRDPHIPAPFDAPSALQAGWAAPEDESVSLRDAWNVCRRNGWLIAGVVLAFAGLAVAYNMYATPKYELSTLIRISGRPLGVGGIEQAPIANAVNTEMEVLGSRTLAADVVDDVTLQFGVDDPERVPRQQLFSYVKGSRSGDTATIVLQRRADKKFILESPAPDAAVGSGTTTPTPGGTPRVPATHLAAAHAAANGIAIGDTVQVAGVRFVLAPGALAYPTIQAHVSRFDDAVGGLMLGVQIIRPNRDADVVRLVQRGRDPYLVRDALNALSGRFIAWRQNAVTADARSRVKLLHDQITSISNDLAESEQQLRAFQESQHVVNPEAEASSSVTRLAQMEADRSGIEAERQALGRMLAEATTQAALRPPGAPSPYTRLMAFPTLLRSGAANQVLPALVSAQERRDSLLLRRTPLDPDVKELNQQIQNLEEQLHQVALTYQQGLTSQVTALDTAIAHYGVQLSQVPRKQVEYARLDRKPKALGELYALLQQQLKEAEIAQAAVDPTVQLVDSAAVPNKPVSPRPMLDLFAAVVLGLVVGCGAAVGRDHLDANVHTRADVQKATGLTVLGFVPHIRSAGTRGGLSFRSRRRALPAPSDDELVTDENGGGELVELGSPESRAQPMREAFGGDVKDRAAVAEAFGRLQTNIQYLNPNESLRTVVLTSPLAADGKTTSAANLALSAAQRGQRVLLIDADLRRGAVHASFRVSRSPGLTGVLRGTHTFEQAVRVFQLGDDAALHVLTTGELPPNPAALLGSDEMTALLRRAETAYEVVIIDSPPVNVVSDAAVLAANAQGVVLVARAGRTARRALEFAAEQLRMVRAPLVGAILNDIDFKRDAAYDGSYRYYGDPALYRLDDAAAWAPSGA